MSSASDDRSAFPEPAGSNPSDGEPSMPYELTVRIEKPMLRRILHDLLNLYLGRKRYLAALILGYAAIALLLKENYSWYTWVVVGLLVIAVLVPMLLHSMMLRRWLRQYRAQQGEAAWYRFDDEGIETVAAHGKDRLPWQEFNSLVKLNDAWLLFTRDNAFTILPLGDLHPSLRDLIVRRIEANDGDII